MKMKPCPFCGGDNIEIESSRWAYCIDCGAEGPLCENESDAIESWNRRTDPPNVLLTLDELRQRGELWKYGLMNITHWMPLPEPPKEGKS